MKRHRIHRHPSQRVGLFLWTLATLLVPAAAQAETRTPILVTVVSPVADSPTASGAELLAAIAEAHPPATERWLIKIEPGVYDIGTAHLEMKPGVDIEGTGVFDTMIVGLGQRLLDFDFSFAEGVVVGADDAELRNLTVQCGTDELHDACIVIANGFASPRITDVRLIAAGVAGSHWGIFNTHGSPVLERLEMVLANGLNNYGIVNVGSDSRPTIRRSIIGVVRASRSNVGIMNRDGGLPAALADVEIVASGGKLAAGVNDLNNADASGETLKANGVTISAFGADSNYGFLGGWHRLLVRESRIEAEAGSAIDFGSSGSVTVLGSDLSGRDNLVQAAEIRIVTSRLRGGGAVTGTVEQCAGVLDDTTTLYSDTCP